MKLCLNMIVKNEAARIERCLASVAPYIASWCSVDTGSSDETKNIIKRFFAQRKLPGVLAEYEFRNFGDARNYALERARIATADWQADYFLLVDADMELVVDDPAWAEKLTAPSYKLAQKNGGLFYWNVRLLRADQRSARYIGVTHEYLSTEGDSPNLTGAWFIDHGDGANREGKFKRDADLLRADVADKARSFYYLAQSLRDMGEKREAAEAYGICAKVARWDEERWSAELNRARCLRDLGAPEWIECALQAFGHRPIRSEPLYDLARHFREQGLNEASLLFSAMGIRLQKPDDLLFIENDIYDFKMDEEFSICAYYSNKYGELGREVCERLATDRRVPIHARETARRNLFWYAQPLDKLCPSFAPWRKLDSPTDWNAMNPSVARLGDTIWAVLRTVNYTIDEAGRYVMPSGETAIRTHNYLVAIEPDGSHRIEQDIPVDLGPPLYDQVLGLEDMRLFAHERELWYIATSRQTNAEGWAEQVYGRIGKQHVLLRPDGERRNEKNWLPLVGKKGIIEFLYSCDPTRVISGAWAMPVSESTPPFACENFRGGSQLIPFDGGYLCLIHEAIESPLDGKRTYQHRIILFDDEIRLQKVSPRFWLQKNNQIEFCAGMCWHPDEERLIISYGIRDAEAWLGTVTANDVRDLLGIPMPKKLEEALNRYWSAKTSEEEWNAYTDARAAGLPASYGENEQPPRRLVPRHSAEVVSDKQRLDEVRHGMVSFDPRAHFWALGQTNRPLRTDEAINIAIEHLKHLKLPLHHDRVKNWDNFIAIAHATAFVAPDALPWIIDAGGTPDSAFLPSLHKMGYNQLMNFNKDENLSVGFSDGIYFGKEDITTLSVGAGGFSFVACLSVIEHGVDVRAFLREMARIIKPGGHLFVSFDYWDSPVDCGNRVAFGAPVRIFAPPDVQDMVAYAGDHGLVPTSAVEYDCQDRVVEWIGLRYTFMNLLFRRT